MPIGYIVLGAFVVVVVALVARKRIVRNMKLANLACALKEGQLRIDMSDLSKARGTTLLKGEVVAMVEGEQVVFHAFSCPVTKRIERVKFWIGDVVYEETMATDKAKEQTYLGLTKALDEHLRKNGLKSILLATSEQDVR